MYKVFRIGNDCYTVTRHDIHKSIRIDRGTLDIIESIPGDSFSEKIIRLALFYKSSQKKL